MNSYNKINLGDKPIISLADWFFRTFGKSDKVVLVFQDDIDLDNVENVFLQYKKFIEKMGKKYEDVELISIGKEINFSSDKQFNELKNCYDDILDLSKVNRLLDTMKAVCLVVSEKILSLKLPVSINPICLYKNKSIDLNDFINSLINFGYKKVHYVENIGEFAVRGQIIDIWPNSQENQRIPLRIILDNVMIGDIRKFNPSTQRSFADATEINSLFIFPVRVILDPKNKEFIDILSASFRLVYVDNSFPVSNSFSKYFKSFRFYGNTERFLAEMQKKIDENYNIFIGYNSDHELDNLKKILKGHNSIVFFEDELLEGFYDTENRIYVTSYAEIFVKYDYIRKQKKVYQGLRLEGMWEIAAGDYVVHKDYGIGKVVGTQIINYGAKAGEFITILYKDDAKLYLPLTDLNKIEKYMSVTNKPPMLSSLDKVSWQKTTNRIKKSLKDFIVKLYDLYTKHKQSKGIAFLCDNDLEKELEKMFDFEETEDQLKALEDVKMDMQSAYPMDRVIVGDVGFGKTEVAIRAAFRAVVNAKQVMILCPTTILAEQHYRTFVDRMSVFGIKVSIVTRLQNKDLVDQTIQQISEHKVDIVIGTHMLLSDKIKFSDLGLVIIDEEHKFGVRHKEKIRLRYRNADSDKELPDLLSLTATPIPRTLSIAMQGIKDISVIETPPSGRLPIETFILPYSEETLKIAINRELNREGQIYYVFNDISLIEHKTNILRRLFPNISTDYVHSKLSSKKIEEIMLKFIRGEIRCLVATTIIESGLDMPNVNTIIVEEADKFGLAQLYQLRGRVGRRDIKAYCYFFYNDDNLTSNAKKRLSALSEFSSLGSGYKLALRDLEIRGAGELLGTKQHGFINNIGLSMYSNIIKEIIDEVRYEIDLSVDKKTDEEPKIELNLPAYIPKNYIDDDETRIVFYRKLINAGTLEQVDEVQEELFDRFGKIVGKGSETLDNLINILKLKILMKCAGIKKIFAADKQSEDLIILECDSVDSFDKIKKKLRNEKLKFQSSMEKRELIFTEVGNKKIFVLEIIRILKDYII